MASDDTTRDIDDEDVDGFDSLDDEKELDGVIVPDDYDDLDDDDDDEDDLDDDEDDDYDDDDDEDDYDDATDDEIDFVVALYREDGVPTVYPLPQASANDLDELIAQLRRMPGDVGALGAVSIAGEFFVLCRVRGRQVQVLLNDSVAAADWPIARDVVDFLGLDVPDSDDDSEVVGDMNILADQGVAEFELESVAEDLDEDSGELVRRIAHDMKFGVPFDKAVGE